MENKFLKSIIAYAQNYQTGCLEVKNLKHVEQPWYLYFRLGRLFWAEGGQQPQRRVYRQLLKQFQKEASQLLLHRQEVSWHSQSAYYDFLAFLFKQKKIAIEQFVAIKNDIIVEVLFDILQVSHQHNTPNTNGNGLYWEWHDNYRPEKYIAISQELSKSSQELIASAQQTWQKWQTAKLSSCSPNQAPIILDREPIEQATAPKTFQNLQRLITGKQSLRDIAIIAKTSNTLKVTQALWGYYQKGWLDFHSIPDLNWEKLASTNPPSQTRVQMASNSSQGKFCVACVDDSLQVTQTLEKIVQEKGYSFQGINDPLRASAILLKTKPDLIFLDLIMPTTNGYEICAQLRRVSSLKEIPIIILTGKDGLIDRMRGKMVGATEYISKPVQRNLILDVMQKYLCPSESHPQRNSNFSSTMSVPSKRQSLLP